jgi:hypothetical protein
MPNAISLCLRCVTSSLTLETDVTMTLDVGAAFPGTSATEASMRAALMELSRDDALFFCARVNAMIAGFDAGGDRSSRQSNALALLQVPKEVTAIESFVAQHGTTAPPVVFFRGQLLELARWVAQHCSNHPGEPETFHSPVVRSAFLRAALIASEFWGRRIFAARLSANGDSRAQLRRALGAFRKGTEEGAEAPHPGVALGRGWLLFSEHMRAHLKDFDGQFEAATGLTLLQYYGCAMILMTRTFATTPNAVIFTTVGFGARTNHPWLFDAFIRLKSQTPEELANALQKPTGISGYKALRERPIVNFSGNRSAILDPVFYFDSLTVSPLFAVVRQAGRSRQNEIFGAFGEAFEGYAIELLESVGSVATTARLAPRSKGKSATGREFEVDSILRDGTSAAVFEMKASWILEEKILTEDPEEFLEEVRRLYGISSTPGERPKGVAQLGKVIGAIARREWMGEHGEYRDVTALYPLLLVHDERLGAAGTGRFLDEEFRRALGMISGDVYVHPLIVMSIADLEHLVGSAAEFGLLEFLHAYSTGNPERMRSVHNFLATSPEFAGRIRPSSHVMKASYALGDEVKALFHGSPAS